jgi:hypothetical protein
MHDIDQIHREYEDDCLTEVKIPQVEVDNLAEICKVVMIACRNQAPRLQLVKTILETVF